jgi:hypothetical protein
MKTAIRILGLCGALTVGVAYATGDYHKDVYCSQGYWKNHTEVWFYKACDGHTAIDSHGTTSCEAMLNDLRARGKGSEAIRDAVTDYLNGWATYKNMYVNC